MQQLPWLPLVLFGCLINPDNSDNVFSCYALSSHIIAMQFAEELQLHGGYKYNTIHYIQCKYAQHPVAL